MITVNELMTRDVVALRETDCLTKADELLHLRHIRHLPVVRGNKLVGLITLHDLLKRLAVPQSDVLSCGSMAMDVMTRAVETVSPTTSLAEAVAHMREARYSCLPVVAEDGTLLGILTEADPVRFLFPLIEDIDRREQSAEYKA